MENTHKFDEKFLDFLLEKLEKDGTNIDEPFFGCPDGTTKGGQGYSIREIIEGIRAGEEQWQDFYEGLRLQYDKDYKI